MKVSEKTGVPYYVVCAFLEQESSGGENVFGHDPTIFIGAGRVTKEKYLKYKAERNRTGKVQGVGPMQLTYGPFQDSADALGGAWKPDINMEVGFGLIKNYWDQTKSWREVGRRYNGKYSYGDQIVDKINKWKRLLS